MHQDGKTSQRRARADSPMTGGMVGSLVQAAHETPSTDSLQFQLEVGTAPTAPVRHLSPLRYPGAKSKLTPLIEKMIRNAIEGGRLRRPLTMFEPFAGGASTTLRLLRDGVIDRGVIADADPLVASFWIEAATNPGALVGAMQDEFDTYVSKGGSRAVARWDYWRQWIPGDDDEAITRASLALKCIFLNRTTFSGILHGSAGPIGGRAQKSDYPIGCRWNQEELARRIEWVAHLYRTGRLATPAEATWQESLEAAALEHAARPGHVVAYLDPPYVAKSGRLYKTSFSQRTEEPDLWQSITPHQTLAEYLKTEAPFRWILSYDDHPDLLRNVLLYGRVKTMPSPATLGQGGKYLNIQRRRVEIQHSASTQQKRRDVAELLLTTLAESDCDGVGERR